MNIRPSVIRPFGKVEFAELWQKRKGETLDLQFRETLVTGDRVDLVEVGESLRPMGPARRTGRVVVGEVFARAESGRTVLKLSEWVTGDRG